MNTIVTEKEAQEAMATIVANRDQKAVNWAVNYAQVGMDMTGEELRVQCLYVLNNISHWRGEEATAVRNILKAYTKQGGRR